MIDKKHSSKVKVVVFDLDDTLFSELDYVRSGLIFVANNLSDYLQIKPSIFTKSLFESLAIDRSFVFDRVLSDISLSSSINIKKCVALYRSHYPQIDLYPDAFSTLTNIARNYPVYIVTDGNKHVQQKKLRALDLYDSPLITKAFITHRYGLHNAKPSPYCFDKIASLEAVEANELVYIADNPKKDFIGIKALGYRTIRVLSGQHKERFYGDNYEAS